MAEIDKPLPNTNQTQVPKEEIIEVEKGGFNLYMKSIGKFGGQNKVPKLCNNREYVKGLKKFSK